PAVPLLSLQCVSRSGDDDFGVELGETGDDGSRPEFRRTDRPGCPDRSGSQHPHHSLSDVRQDRDYLVPRLDTYRLQVLGKSRSFLTEFWPGDFRSLPVLCDGHQGGAVPALQEVAGEVDGTSRKPLSVWHGFASPDGAGRTAELDAGKAGEQFPETFRLID